MTPRIIFILPLSYFLLIGSLTAQTMLQFVDESPHNLESVWSIQVRQLNQANQTVYFRAIIREKRAGEVYRARSANWPMEPGVSQLHVGALQPLDIEIDRLTETGELPNGVYWFQITLFSADDDREIASVVARSEITDARQNDFKPAPTAKNNQNLFSAHGRWRTACHIQQPPPDNTRLPPSYYRSELQSEARLFRIPIQIGALYTTEQNQTFGPSNQWSISIDKAAIKAEALRLLAESADPERLFDSSEIRRVEQYRHYLHDKRYPMYGEWKEKYDSLNLDEAAKSGRQLQNLETALDNPHIKAQIHELDGYKAQYQIDSLGDLSALSDRAPDSIVHKIERLMRLEQSFRRLEDQKAALSEEARQFEKHEDLYKRVKLAQRDQKITDLAKRPDDIRAGLRTFAPVSKLQRFLLGIDELEVGNCYPYFSTLTLDGTRLRGANIAYTHTNKWHWGIAGGIKKPFVPNDTVYQYLSARYTYFQQYAVAVEVGKGRPNDNFFYARGIRFWDFGQSVAVESNQPRSENYIAGLAFQYRDRKQILTAKGEINQSLYNPDQNAPVIQNGAKNYVVRMLGGTQKTGSATDWSYEGSIKVVLPNDRTQFSAMIYHVGPGYRSAGVPFMMTDITRYEVRGRQDFWRKKMQWSGFFRRDFDQTTPATFGTRTFTTGWGIQGRLAPAKAWSVSLDYTPYAQQRESSTDAAAAISRKGQIWIAAWQYRKKIGQFNWTSHAGWVFQHLTQQDTSALYKVQSVQTAQQWSSRRLIWAFSAQLTHKNIWREQASITHTILYAFDGSVSMLQIGKKLNLTTGLQHIRERSTSALDGAYTRIGLNIHRHVQIDANYRYAYVARIGVPQRFTQQYGWLALSFKW